jgi:hypothetical protein
MLQDSMYTAAGCQERHEAPMMSRLRLRNSASMFTTVLYRKGREHNRKVWWRCEEVRLRVWDDVHAQIEEVSLHFHHGAANDAKRYTYISHATCEAAAVHSQVFERVVQSQVE